MIAKVKYQVATYQGTLDVNCDSDEEAEMIIARAKALLRQRAGGSLPYGYENWQVIYRN